MIENSKITAIKKAVEKVSVGKWYISGFKTNGLSVVHNASDNRMFGITAETFEAEYVVATNPVAISELISTFEADTKALRWWCQQLLDIIENYDILHDACEEEIALLNDIRAAVDPASSQKCSGTQTGVAT